MRDAAGTPIGPRRRLRQVLGAEAAECGLACLVMIGRYHGQDLDLNGVRQRFPVSLSGASLRSVMLLADQLGLACRALRVELEGLRHLKLPAILHWNLDHFVVLESIRGNNAVILDPARGRRRVSPTELSNRFSGVAVELSPVGEISRIKASAPIRLNSLWSKARGHWSSALQLLFLSLALQAVTLAAPFQMQFVIDEALASGDIDLLTVIAIGFGALIVVQCLLEALRGWTLQIVGFVMSYQVMGNLVHHLMRLSSSFFERRHVGDILSRLGSASAIQNFFTQGVIAALIDGVMALSSIIILYVYSPNLATIVLASVILMVLVALAFYPAMRSRLEEKLISSANEQSFLIETVRAATTIKIMGREAERESDWRNLFSNVASASLASGQLGITVSLLQSLIGGLQSVVIIWLGAKIIIDGDGFSVGMLIAFLAYRQTFTGRISALINQLIQFRLLGLHLDRIGDIVGSEPDPVSGPVLNETAEGAISLRDVSFRYGASDPYVLENVCLNINPGDFVVVTGPSGGGKTTLLKLILGLQVPTSGEILLEGIPSTPERWRGWRTNVGVVAQDDRLLSGTIADNICFFDPDMTMERIKKAARAARIHDEIMRKPMQYRTLIGDMGSSLSGGQRQRILLARALYRDPSILILDEGTVNVDESTENALIDLIASLPITRIVVTHRQSIALRAGRVVSVNQKVVANASKPGTIVQGVL